MNPQSSSKQPSILYALWMLAVLLACNLGTSGNAPPTLVPRLTPTPAPTIGYIAPEQIEAPLGVSTAPPRAEVELFQMTNQVGSDRLMVHVDALQRFYSRHVNSRQDSPTEGIGAAADYIIGQFNAIAAASSGNLYTFEHEFPLTYNGITTRQRNLVAVIQGREQGAGAIVVGAHYDSVGDAELLSATTYAPGANDNASGVAALIEIARIMSQKQYRSTIVFVAFSAEEVGRKGSIAFTNWVKERQIDVIAMINIDGLGNIHDRFGNVNDRDLRVFSVGPNDGSTSRELARKINFIGFNQQLKLNLVVQDAIDRENRYGDHFSFTEAGYPSIRIMQANEEKLNADPTDTIEAMEAGYFADSVQTLIALLTALADGPRPPRNITLRDMGNGIQRLVWEPVADAASYVVALRFPNSLIYDQQIEITDTFVEWDKFGRYASVAIAARDARGLMGPLSAEYVIKR